jgi:phthiodiolone/phenolphthiodiolone dimycocerosates ketoreductase
MAEAPTLSAPLATPWFLGTNGMEQVSPGDAIANSIAAIQEIERLGYAAYGLTDQTQSWTFRSLWAPDLVPGASVYPDFEAFFDTIPLMALLAHVTSRIRLGATIDAYRRPPGLIAQTLNTLDNIAHGRIAVSLGTGENKQFLPYGLERSEPRNARLEEMLLATKALMRSAEPVTRESRFYPLSEALIGLQPYDERQPMRLLVSGGGPRLMKAVARAGDGLTSYFPGAYADRVEALQDDLAVLDAEVERIGRDRSEIVVNARNTMVMLCETDEQITRCYDNPYTKSMALNLVPRGEHWRTWGSRHPLGDDWALSVTHRSTMFTRDEALAVVAQVTDEDVAHTLYIGTPEDVARRAVPWLRASGVTHAAPTYLANHSTWVVPELNEPGPDGTPRWHALLMRYYDEVNRLLAA